MSQTHVMDREGVVRKHKRPKTVTVYESIRVLLKQSGGDPVDLGDFHTHAVPSSGGPDSPPFYFVGQHKEISSLWICHCRDFRYRGSADYDCGHIKKAKGAA